MLKYIYKYNSLKECPKCNGKKSILYKNKEDKMVLKTCTYCRGKGIICELNIEKYK